MKNDLLTACFLEKALTINCKSYSYYKTDSYIVTIFSTISLKLRELGAVAAFSSDLACNTHTTS